MVTRSATGDGLLDRGRRLLLAGHVGLHYQCGPAVCPDRRRQAVQPVAAPRHQGDGRSLVGQPPCGRGTDPAARPRDQGDRLLKLSRHGPIITALDPIRRGSVYLNGWERRSICG
jgi:hypothetical protein